MKVNVIIIVLKYVNSNLLERVIFFQFLNNEILQKK